MEAERKVQAWRKFQRSRAKRRFLERFSPELFAAVIGGADREDIGPLLYEAARLCGMGIGGDKSAYWTDLEYRFLAAFCDDVPGSEEE